MMEKEEHIEFIEEKKAESKPARRGLIKDLLDGTVLTRDNVLKQMPFFLFLTVLAIFYIGNRYNAEKVMRRTIVLQNEVKELRAKEITTAAKLMYQSKQSEVAKLVKENNLELEESVKPPKKIILKKKELEQ